MADVTDERRRRRDSPQAARPTPHLADNGMVCIEMAAIHSLVTTRAIDLRLSTTRMHHTDTTIRDNEDRTSDDS